LFSDIVGEGLIMKIHILKRTNELRGTAFHKKGGWLELLPNGQSVILTSEASPLHRNAYRGFSKS